MSYASAKKRYENDAIESTDDETQKLMCSMPGCKNRWTVKIDKPMCSFHQWGQAPKVYTNYTEPKEIEFGENT